MGLRKEEERRRQRKRERERECERETFGDVKIYLQREIEKGTLHLNCQISLGVATLSSQNLDRYLGI